MRQRDCVTVHVEYTSIDIFRRLVTDTIDLVLSD